MANIEINENERAIILEALDLYYRKMENERNQDFTKAKDIIELKKVTDNYGDKENAIYQLRPKLHKTDNPKNSTSMSEVNELMEAMEKYVSMWM